MRSVQPFLSANATRLIKSLNYSDNEESKVLAKHIPLIIMIMSQCIVNRTIEDDDLQCCIIDAIRAIRKYDAKRNFKITTIITTYVKNGIYNRFRSETSDCRNVNKTEFMGENDIDEIQEAEVQTDLEFKLEKALKKLKKRDRQLLKYRFKDDMNGPEIAKLTSQSKANVNYRVRWALRQLHKELVALI